MDLSQGRRRALRWLVGTFLVYALLVATHLGEFWPFSIYPMFSQAGNPWSRAVVREVPEPEALSWETAGAETLPGDPFPLRVHGIDPIDLSNFVSKTDTWDEARLAGLRRMFYDHVDRRALLVMRVNGRIDSDDTVHLDFVPYVLVAPDSTALNPVLRR